MNLRIMMHQSKNALAKIKRTILVTAAALVLSLGLLPALAYADTAGDIQGGVDAAAGGADTKNAGTNISTTLANVINILSLAIGIIAVVVIIIAGLNYITSAGDDTKVASAKRTILNAAIGLIIVGMAQIIVRFVINASDSDDKTPVIPKSAPKEAAPSSGSSGGSSSSKKPLLLE